MTLPGARAGQGTAPIVPSSKTSPLSIPYLFIDARSGSSYIKRCATSEGGKSYALVCNTAFFGGSLVVSPHYDAVRRTLYSHDGSSLFTTQTAPLPVYDLVRAQRGKKDKTKKRKTDRLFIDPPPGCKEMTQLSLRQVKL